MLALRSYPAPYRFFVLFAACVSAEAASIRASAGVALPFLSTVPATFATFGDVVSGVSFCAGLLAVLRGEFGFIAAMHSPRGC